MRCIFALRRIDLPNKVALARGAERRTINGNAARMHPYRSAFTADTGATTTEKVDCRREDGRHAGHIRWGDQTPHRDTGAHRKDSDRPGPKDQHTGDQTPFRERVPCQNGPSLTSSENPDTEDHPPLNGEMPEKATVALLPSGSQKTRIALPVVKEGEPRMDTACTSCK